MIRFTIGLILTLCCTALLAAQDTIADPQNTSDGSAAVATDGGDRAALSQIAPAVGFSHGDVARAVFTSDIVGREPTDDISQIDTTHNQVYFFSELLGMSGHTAIHRWEHDGKVVAEVKFDVAGPRWRVWSSKLLPVEQTGTWTVSVINTAGEVLTTTELQFSDASAVTAPAVPATGSAQ